MGICWRDRYSSYTPYVVWVMAACKTSRAGWSLWTLWGLKDRRRFARIYLQPGSDVGLVEITQPDQPTSRTLGYGLPV